MSRKVFASVLSIFVFACASLRAAIPGADNPHVYTQIDYGKDLLDYNQRTLGKAYEAGGKRDPKWDSAAMELLNGMAVYFTDASVNERAYPAPIPDRKALEKSGKAAVDAGCDDPLVMYCYGALLDDRHARAEAMPYLIRAANKMTDANYPIMRAIYAHERLMRHFDPKKDAAAMDKHWKVEFDEWLAAIAAGDLKGFDRRVYYNDFQSEFQSRPFEQREQFVQRLEALQQSEPWLTNMIEGRYHIDAAWHARGSGWANSVTQEGWKEMASQLKQAYDCLNKAYQLEPKYPEAATQMIAVLMGGGGQNPAENIRTWFNRAVEGQFDFLEAYNNLLYAMLPRWEGNHAMMLAFGEECAATKRYDTAVPYQFIVAAKKVADDMGGQPGIFTEPAVYKTACEVLDGYAASPREPDGREWYLGFKAGIQYQSAKFVDGYATLKQMRKDDLHQAKCTDGIETAGQLPSRILPALPLLGGAHAPECKTAEEAFAAGKVDDAIKIYQTLVGELKPDDPGAPFASMRLQELKWQKSFAGGEEFSIQPDAKLNGWYSLAGKWHVEPDGTLVGESDADGLGILCGCNFGRRWELTYSIDFDMSDRTHLISPGTITYYATPDDNYGIWMGAPWGKMFAARGIYSQPMDVAFTGKDRVDIGMWDNINGLSINQNQQVAVGMNREGGPEWRRAYVGVGAWKFAIRPGVKVRFKDLKIRKLTEEPLFAHAGPPSGKL